MQHTRTRETDGPSDPAVGVSANFLLIALLVCGLGFSIGGGLVQGSGAAFAFVMASWVLGLCLHEFGHAAVAWRGGDSGVRASGYLSLDPLAYANPVASIVLPLVFTILGGIGFPGGAVTLDRDALRGRLWATCVALAGPAMTLACILGLVILYHLSGDRPQALRAVLAVTALFQGTALVLNLMPIPGLDGYGALRPWLPGSWQALGDAGARHAGLVLTALFLFSGAFSRTLFRISLRLVAEAGIDPADVVDGYRLIRLW